MREMITTTTTTRGGGHFENSEKEDLWVLDGEERSFTHPPMKIGSDVSVTKMGENATKIGK